MVPEFLSGQFLLAMPGIGDPRFEHAVVAMCAHDADGAIGVGVGHVVGGLGTHALFRQFDLPVDRIADAPVHRGGPVEPRRGFVLHGDDWGGQDTVDVAGRWQLTGTLDVLRALSEGTGPAQWLLAIGYAGWGPGQLDEEMTGHGWFPTAAGADLLFGTSAADRWSTGFARAGIDTRLLVPDAGTA